MAEQTQDRWTEIRALHKEHGLLYRLLGGLALVLVGIGIGSWLFGPNGLYREDGYSTNLFTEFISIGVTVFVIDLLNRQRDERSRVKDLQARLLREVRSPEPAVRNHAIHELREHGWLTGENGLLKGASLLGANLQGANLTEANLQGARLWNGNLQGANLLYANLQSTSLIRANLNGASLLGANLQGANLLYAKLQNANLVIANLQGTDLQHANLQGADLVGLNLHGANLRDANLRGAKGVDLAGFDEKTVLSDGVWDEEKGQYTPDSYWTPDTDMTRYTDPDHPDFWEPEWVKQQRARGESS